MSVALAMIGCRRRWALERGTGLVRAIACPAFWEKGAVRRRSGARGVRSVKAPDLGRFLSCSASGSPGLLGDGAVWSRALLWAELPHGDRDAVSLGLPSLLGEGGRPETNAVFSVGMFWTRELVVRPAFWEKGAVRGHAMAR